jgi:hypothetical protein
MQESRDMGYHLSHMVPLSPETRRRVESLFTPENQKCVGNRLEYECADNLPFCERLDMFGLERLRFAVLKLSAGDVDALGREIEQAKRDWRDTLMAAGFGQDVTAHQRWFPDRRIES